jgi:ABC-type multidrug transport system fused ATPase/permease subunit
MLQAVKTEDITQALVGAKFSLPIRRTLRFAEHHIWTIRDALAGSWWTAAGIAGLSILGAVAGGGTLGLIGLYVDTIGTKGAIEVPVIGVTITSALWSLIALVGAILGMLLFSAGAIYISAVRIRRFGRHYQVRSVAALMEAYAKLPLLQRGRYMPEGHSVANVAMGRSRLIGRTVENMIQSLRPIFASMVALIIVIYIDWQLTLYFVSAVLIAIPVIYIVSFEIRKNAKIYYDVARRGWSRAVGSRFKILAANSFHRPSLDSSEANLKVDSDAIFALDSYDKFRLASRKMEFVTSLFKAVFFTATVLILGYQAVNDMMTWGEMFVYTGALYLLVIQFQSLADLLVKLIRYHPALEIYLNVIRSARETQTTGVTPPVIPVKFKIGCEPVLAGSQSSTPARPGQPIACICDRKAADSNGDSLIQALKGATNLTSRLWLRAGLIGRGYDYMPGSLLDNLTYQENERAQGLIEEAIRNLGLFPEVEGLPQGPRTTLTDEVWQALSENLKATIRLFAAGSSDCPLLLIDCCTFRSASPSVARELLNRMNEKIVFVTGVQTSAHLNLLSQCVVIQDGRVTGIGDRVWAEKLLSSLEWNVSAERTAMGDFDDEDD